MILFFKQKTAYELLRSLVGSEMCIRDRIPTVIKYGTLVLIAILLLIFVIRPARKALKAASVCLLYTSDAADDLLCVDLGGRRIIKKKKTNSPTETTNTPKNTQRHNPDPANHHT